MPFVRPEIACPPWRLSGTVYGTLLNDLASLALLGDAVNAAPYKAPPRAPVLYLKPRNTLAASGAEVVAPSGGLEIGAALGIVVGRAASRVSPTQASAVVAGYVLVADLCVPHSSLYRPSVRLRARDGSCLIGGTVCPASVLSRPEALPISVSIDGRVARTARDVTWQRSVAQLVSDVTEFMTLSPGDVLLLGVAADAPRVAPGQRFSVDAPGFAPVEGRVIAEAEAV